MLRVIAPLVAVLVAVLLMTMALWAGQRRLMYFPDRHVPAPGTLGLGDVESVEFASGDGVIVRGWYLPARANARFAVIVFNGNAGNRAYRVALGEALRARGLSVLLFDPRGFGDSTGAPSERGLYADARAARAYLIARRDVDADALVYFGESLGAAIALELAIEHPPAAVVLRSPFTSMADVAAVHYPMLPVQWLVRDRYASLDRVAQLTVPLLVVAGDQDRIVPLDQSRRIHEAASVPKELVVIPGADHNDLVLNAGRPLVEAIVRFLDRVATRGGE